MVSVFLLGKVIKKFSDKNLANLNQLINPFPTMFHLWINQVVGFYVDFYVGFYVFLLKMSLPQVFFKHFASKNQIVKRVNLISSNSFNIRSVHVQNLDLILLFLTSVFSFKSLIVILRLKKPSRMSHIFYNVTFRFGETSQYFQ